MPSTPAAAQNQPRQIRIEYAAPKNPAHRQIHDEVKRARALEHLQELLSPLRLPEPLLLKVAGCDGTPNAWYEDKAITVCYELLEDFLNSAPRRDLPGGIGRTDAVVGTALGVFLHETGHAVFHMLQIPVLGREEDAADQFSAFVMLKLEKAAARRMILGAAYQYKQSSPRWRAFLPLKAFADEHSLPAQRLFNILCMAYGADQTLFADVVEQGYLPKERAESCAAEYGDIAFAFTTLIGPHIDRELARDFHKVWARAASERKAMPGKR